MSACVQLLLERGEKDRISQWLNDLGANEDSPYGNKGLFCVPDDKSGNSGFIIHWSSYRIYGDEGENPNWEGHDVLELEYKIWDGNSGGEWAVAVAQEIIKRYNVLAAGWDSVGYCKTLDDFKACRPFRAAIRQREKAIRGLSFDLQKLYQQEIQECKRLQKLMEQKAIEVLDGSKEFIFRFPATK